MSKFEDYRDKHKCMKMSRDEHGILEIVLHTNGSSLRWTLESHMGLQKGWRDIALDNDNRVILVTGVGDEFLGPRADEPGGQTGHAVIDAERLMLGGFGQQEKISAMLDAPVPVICAVNGPVRRHIETALLADVVIASDTASFEDSAHFELQDLVPGDGVQVLANMLLGINRARAFMLLGTVIDAQEALRLGLVAEIVPKGQELERARVIARRMAEKSDSTLRCTRALLVHPIKKAMLELLGVGQAYQAVARLGR